MWLAAMQGLAIAVPHLGLGDPPPPQVPTSLGHPWGGLAGSGGSLG